MIKTETPSAEHTDLDLYPVDKLVATLVDDQLTAVNAVRAASTQIARAVEAAVPRMRAGGRLIYVGAGTSGRLGLLDSVELFPTFSWPKERALSLLAGGQRALYEAVEGAEDSFEQGAADLRATGAGSNDVVLILAASGATPYAMGALSAARAVGAQSVGFANNADAPLAMEAEFGVTLDTGSEIISGSTRLKAGTSQKIALNTFSSALMVRLNKIYGNLMVDVKPTNAKLVRRAVRLTSLATGAAEDVARATLEQCEFRVKVAIVAIARNLSVQEAASRLAQVDGSVRAAIAG